MVSQRYHTNSLNAPLKIRSRNFWVSVRSFILVLILACSFISGYSQKTPDYAIQANIIYHFTKYINWPPHKQSGDFIIGVVGESPIYAALDASLANKKAGNQRIVIKQISGSSSLASCHILFLCDEESYLIGKISEKTLKSNTLIVTESEGIAKKGSCINFTVIADRLKLEINKSNIEKRNLSVASELLQLGKIVE